MGIAQVFSAQDGLSNFQENVLNKINALTRRVDILYANIFRCPTEKSGYRILEGQCYFFEKVDRDYSATQSYCKTAFGPNIVGKLWEPKSLKINSVVGAEAGNIFGYGYGFWIGISNDGKFRYQSSGETAAWNIGFPVPLPYLNENQKTGFIGTTHCLQYSLYTSTWMTSAFCTGSSDQTYTVCEIDN